MTAETIAKVLAGRKAGGGWVARCPAHDDREPSLSIREAGNGKVLVRCHAGCDQAQVIAKLRSRGLWEDNSHRQRDCIHQQPRLSANNQPDRDDAKRTKAALSIWQWRRQTARWSRRICDHAASLCRFRPRSAPMLG